MSIVCDCPTLMLSVINEDYWIPNEAGKLVVIQSKQLEPQSNIPASLISLPQPPAILGQKISLFLWTIGNSLHDTKYLKKHLIFVCVL